MNLKQILLKLENKIENINRLIELTQNSEILLQIDVRKQLINELKKEKGYYYDLNHLLQLLNKEQLEFFKHPLKAS